jgi:hypothetical protein
VTHPGRIQEGDVIGVAAAAGVALGALVAWSAAGAARDGSAAGVGALRVIAGAALAALTALAALAGAPAAAVLAAMVAIALGVGPALMAVRRRRVQRGVVVVALPHTGRARQGVLGRRAA